MIQFPFREIVLDSFFYTVVGIYFRTCSLFCSLFCLFYASLSTDIVTSKWTWHHAVQPALYLVLRTSRDELLFHCDPMARKASVDGLTMNGWKNLIMNFIYTVHINLRRLSHAFSSQDWRMGSHKFHWIRRDNLELHHLHKNTYYTYI